MPFGAALRRVAEKVLHERVVIEPKRSTRPPSARFSDDQVRGLRAAHLEGASVKNLSQVVLMAEESLKHILDGTNYSKVL